VHELAFLSPTPGAVDEFKPLLAAFVSDNSGLSRESLVALAHKIIEIVYREASDCCASPKVALDPLRDFLAGLFAAGRTRIYSTNYDDFVLQAVPGLYTGFSGPADPSRFDIDTFWDHAEENALFHLHGSVHFGFPTPAAGAEIGELFWYEDRADAALHSTFHGSSVSRMDGSSFMPTAVITGLDKLSRLQQRPLSYYFRALSRCDVRRRFVRPGLRSRRSPLKYVAEGGPLEEEAHTARVCRLHAERPKRRALDGRCKTDPAFPLPRGAHRARNAWTRGGTRVDGHR
jgi:hypothetical protein